MGFAEYSERWMQLIRTEPSSSGKMRAAGTVRSYQSKMTGYLVPEFGDTPLREIDVARIQVMTDRLDQIPAPLNPKSKFNGITRPVLLAAWCQLRRGECLGLQRRDIEWHDGGGATLHVRRQLNANTGDYTDLKSDAGRRSQS